MSIALSVSIACFPSLKRKQLVRSLGENWVGDLHCDLFGTEPGTGIAESELLHLEDVWPHSLSIHHWSTDTSVVMDRLHPSRNRRLIVELVGELKIDRVSVSEAVEAGWQVLVGCRPPLVDVAVDLVRAHGCQGVQLLTTSTPGRAGGQFIETAWPVVTRLRAAMGSKAVELDGGISVSAAQKAQSLRCNMVVLGTNALQIDGESPLSGVLSAILQRLDCEDAQCSTK